MNGGVKASLLVSCLAFAGCTTATKEVKVRAIPDPSTVLFQGGDEIAVARGQMVLGNVGLALEGFRKAQRASPSNPAALAGIGDCYAVMGRFDLAQSNYEAALALAPHNRQLLLGLATIFDREGKPVLAIAARAEAAIGSQAATQPATATAAKVSAQNAAKVLGRAPISSTSAREPDPILARAEKPVEIPRPSIGSVTVELPRARPVERVDAPTTRLQASAIQVEVPTAVALTAAPAQISRPAVQPQIAQFAEIPHASIGSVTVELPPAHAVERVEVAVAELSPVEITPAIAPAPVQTATPTIAKPAEQTVEIPRPSLESAMLAVPTPRRVEHVEAQAVQLEPTKIEALLPAAVEATASDTPARQQLPRKPVPTDEGAVAVAVAPAPRLERLTSGEVALITTDKPLWRSAANVQTASGSTVKWVALASPQGRPNVQILNAARSQGIAASARTVLLDRGWRRIAVGDAPAILHKSVVLYPKSRAALGHRLAAQFGVGAQMAERDNVVLIIGRDSVGRISGRRGS